MSSTWSFEWDRGRGDVAALGGMLAPVFFDLEDGRQVQPFAIAPWADEPGTEALPGILRRLRGEWPCVPFGMPQAPDGLPSDWTTDEAAPFHREPHGPSSNHDWHLLDHFGTGVELGYTYPDDHPVERLVRRIEGRAGATVLDLSLTIHMRVTADLPVGLHPVLALPKHLGAAKLVLPAKEAMVFPLPTEPDVSRLTPGAVISDLRGAPSIDGTADLTCLPLPGRTEELVQVAVIEGRASLENREDGYRMNLEWDAQHFPFCLLWISNMGRSQSPWNNRHLALGVEPVCAAFDLGVGVSRANDNPLVRLGATTRRLTAGAPFVTRYAMGVSHVETPQRFR